MIVLWGRGILHMDKTQKLSILSLLFNIAYSAYHIGLGVWSNSWWLFTIGIYYAILSLIRFAILRTKQNSIFLIRFTGIMLMLLSVPLVGRVTIIIRTSLKALIFGAFRLVVLARLIPCVVLRTKNHLKVKALRSEIFWLTNICQQQENAEDSILIRSRRLTN